MRHFLQYRILFIAMAPAVIILVPITEEFLFRGLLQSWLKQKLRSPLCSILFSSGIFVFFHYSSQLGLSNIPLLSSLFVLSCMLGYLYERQHSLWAPIGLHCFFNFMSLLLLSVEGR